MSRRLYQVSAMLLIVGALLPAQQTADSGRAPDASEGVDSTAADRQSVGASGVNLIVGTWMARRAQIRFDQDGHYAITYANGVQMLGSWTVDGEVLTRVPRCWRHDDTREWQNGLQEPTERSQVLEMTAQRLRISGEDAADYLRASDTSVSAVADPKEWQACEQVITTSNAQAAAAADSVTAAAERATRYEKLAVVMFFVSLVAFSILMRAIVAQVRARVTANLGVGPEAIVIHRTQVRGLAIERGLFTYGMPVVFAGGVAAVISNRSLGLGGTTFLYVSMLALITWQIRRFEKIAVGHRIDLDRRIVRTNDGDMIDIDAITSLQGMRTYKQASVLVTTDTDSYTLHVADDAEKNRLTTLLGRAANLA